MYWRRATDLEELGINQATKTVRLPSWPVAWRSHATLHKAMQAARPHVAGREARRAAGIAKIPLITARLPS
jgi:hypothetical protein